MQETLSPQSRQHDLLDPARATALAVTLGRGEVIEHGDALPPFFHQVYFWDPHPPEALGRDGHATVGGLIPDMDLPRRMWAGGRLALHRPLRAGIPAEKRSTCSAVTKKQGHSGPLALVTLRHDFIQEGALCVTEWQDLVYRAEADPTSPPPIPPLAPTKADVTEPLCFTSTDLFRYSALTFNGHRIHYDVPYAQEIEGYAGLVVHGPLLAQNLMLLAEARLGQLSAFAFRATAPLMLGEHAEMCCKDLSFWVQGADGRQCMSAEAAPLSE